MTDEQIKSLTIRYHKSNIDYCLEEIKKIKDSVSESEERIAKLDLRISKSLLAIESLTKV